MSKAARCGVTVPTNSSYLPFRNKNPAGTGCRTGSCPALAVFIERPQADPDQISALIRVVNRSPAGLSNRGAVGRSAVAVLPALPDTASCAPAVISKHRSSGRDSSLQDLRRMHRGRCLGHSGNRPRSSWDPRPVRPHTETRMPAFSPLYYAVWAISISTAGTKGS